VTPDFPEGKQPAISHGADPANPSQAPIPTSDEVPWEQWSGLDLGGIRIKNLSPAMFTFSHITSLYINHNVLSVLPAAISNLRQLTVLDATANELTSVPPELGMLSKLKELFLFDNHLTSLPAELGTLYKLEMIGMEGNPLEDRFRKILAEEGTQALIHHLRDNCPAGVQPPQRQWIEVEPVINSPSDQHESFTTLTYNILCDSFAPPSSYHYVPLWALDWNYRKTTILQEIINASADIVCLQEIDGGQYRQFFYPELKKEMYEGCHYARTRARTMTGKEADAVDGCAIFWKKDR
jgi:CCR4-NOT transcription complex subunit 6